MEKEKKYLHLNEIKKLLGFAGIVSAMANYSAEENSNETTKEEDEGYETSQNSQGK